MVERQARFFVLVILLAALPAISPAQDTNTVITNVTKALGAENLKTLRYSGSGSSYASSAATRVKTYTREIDLYAPSSRIQIVRVQGQPAADQSENVVINASSPWASQLELWISPYGFLKGAGANKATATTETVFGEKFTVLTFTAQGKYKVKGYVNDKNLIEKIETWLDSPDTPDTLVEVNFRDYQDFGGVKFPTTIIQKRGGALALILIVNDVKPNVTLGTNG